jgi:hypothetical protein
LDPLGFFFPVGERFPLVSFLFSLFFDEFVVESGKKVGDPAANFQEGDFNVHNQITLLQQQPNQIPVPKFRPQSIIFLPSVCSKNGKNPPFSLEF